MLGRGYCSWQIIFPKESHRVWCVQISVNEEPHTGGLGPLRLLIHENEIKWQSAILSM
jgi:hypothetical protein